MRRRARTASRPDRSTTGSSSDSSAVSSDSRRRQSVALPTTRLARTSSSGNSSNQGFSRRNSGSAAVTSPAGSRRVKIHSERRISSGSRPRSRHPRPTGCDRDRDGTAGRDRSHPSALELHVATRPRHGFAAPEALHGLEGLVEQADSLADGQIGEAEVRVVGPVTGRDHTAQTAGGQAFRGRDGLRELCGIPVVDQANRADLNPLGAGEQRHCDGPAVQHVAFALRGEHRDIAVDEGSREAEFFGEPDQREQFFPRMRVPGERDAELHPNPPKPEPIRGDPAGGRPAAARARSWRRGWRRSRPCRSRRGAASGRAR